MKRKKQPQRSPSERELHRADYEACRRAGFESPGELLAAYKALSSKSVVAHTPGPWYCTPTDHDSSGYYIRGSEADGSPETIGKGCVAIIPRSSVKPMEANARLIAAAPAMLSVLKAICEHTEPFWQAADVIDQAEGNPGVSGAEKQTRTADRKPSGLGSRSKYTSGITEQASPGSKGSGSSDPPHSANDQFIPITNADALRAAGFTYPSTEHGWRWLYRKRAERGLDSAFKRVGRRILVDVQAYSVAIRDQKND